MQQLESQAEQKALLRSWAEEHGLLSPKGPAQPYDPEPKSVLELATRAADFGLAQSQPAEHTLEELMGELETLFDNQKNAFSTFTRSFVQELREPDKNGSWDLKASLGDAPPAYRSLNQGPKVGFQAQGRSTTPVSSDSGGMNELNNRMQRMQVQTATQTNSAAAPPNYRPAYAQFRGATGANAVPVGSAATPTGSALAAGPGAPPMRSFSCIYCRGMDHGKARYALLSDHLSKGLVKLDPQTKHVQLPNGEPVPIKPQDKNSMYAYVESKTKTSTGTSTEQNQVNSIELEPTPKEEPPSLRIPDVPSFAGYIEVDGTEESSWETESMPSSSSEEPEQMYEALPLDAMAAKRSRDEEQDDRDQGPKKRRNLKRE